jgi:hypothetical protein
MAGASPSTYSVIMGLVACSAQDRRPSVGSANKGRYSYTPSSVLVPILPSFTLAFPLKRGKDSSVGAIQKR